jgi:hypothetical protein
MAQRSTQPLTEMSTRSLPGGKGRPARKANNLLADCLDRMWEPQRLTTLWASTACYRDSFTFSVSSGGTQGAARLEGNVQMLATLVVLDVSLFFQPTCPLKGLMEAEPTPIWVSERQPRVWWVGQWLLHSLC